MNYELALKLKDAGFPQHSTTHEPVFLNRLGISTDDAYNPILSELIEACGLNTFLLEKLSNGKWYAYQNGNPRQGVGTTPEDAVANLWLELNKK